MIDPACKELLKSFKAEISILTNEKKQLAYRIKYVDIIVTRYMACKWWQYKKKAKYANRLKQNLRCD